MSTDQLNPREALAKGGKQFVERQADAMVYIDQAMKADEALGHARTVKALILCGGRSTQFYPIIDKLIEEAAASESGMTANEKLYLKAARLTRANRPTESASVYEQILADDPTDMLACSFVQQDLFWLGEAPWMRSIMLRSKDAMTKDHPDYSAFLSNLAFALEEAGDRVDAEKAGREAIEINPNDPWGAHAVAHVLVMQGRTEDGVSWLEPLSGNWAEANQIAHHLWWHLCLFLLERGEHDRILDILDNKVRNPESPLVKSMPHLYIDLQNVAAMLMRLELRGVDIGDRWSTIAEAAEVRIGDFTNPFTNAHAVMTLAANGAFDKAEEVIRAMEGASSETSDFIAARMISSAIPASKAALAWRKGDYEAVLQQLLPFRGQLWQMGGSHAQRDVFSQLLFDASRKLGRSDAVSLTLEHARNAGFERATETTLYRDAA